MLEPGEGLSSVLAPCLEYGTIDVSLDEDDETGGVTMTSWSGVMSLLKSIVIGLLLSTWPMYSTLESGIVGILHEYTSHIRHTHR